MLPNWLSKIKATFKGTSYIQMVPFWVPVTVTEGLTKEQITLDCLPAFTMQTARLTVRSLLLPTLNSQPSHTSDMNSYPWPEKSNQSKCLYFKVSQQKNLKLKKSRNQRELIKRKTESTWHFSYDFKVHLLLRHWGRFLFKFLTCFKHDFI